MGDSVKGAFQTFGVSAGRFGYGDTVQKDQLRALLDLKDGKGDLPAKVGDAVAAGVLGGLRMR